MRPGIRNRNSYCLLLSPQGVGPMKVIRGAPWFLECGLADTGVTVRHRQNVLKLSFGPGDSAILEDVLCGTVRANLSLQLTATYDQLDLGSFENEKVICV